MIPKAALRSGSDHDSDLMEAVRGGQAVPGSCGFAPRREDRGLVRYLDDLAEAVVAHTPPGPLRDRDLARSVGDELLDGILVRRWFDDLDDVERATLLDAATAYVRRWASPKVCARLEPAHRIMVHCLANRHEEDLTDVVRYRAFGTAVRAIVDGGCVYAGLPLFRNPATDIPDSCYDLSSRLWVEHWLNEPVWHGTMVRLSGQAFISYVDTDDQFTTLVLRERSTGEEFCVPTRLRSTPEASGRFHDGLYEYGYAGFDAVIDVDSLPGGGALPNGKWDLWIEVCAHGVVRRCPATVPTKAGSRPHAEHHLPDFANRDAGLVTSYVSHDGRATFFVDTYGDLATDLVRLTHCESTRVGLTITAYSGLSDWPAGTTARLCLVRGAVTRTFPALMRPVGDGFGLSAHIGASKLWLPSGWWGVGLRLSWGHGCWEVPIHDADGQQMWVRGRKSTREFLGRVRDSVRA